MAKILLVEDDKSLREIYGVRLMAEGYTIVSAGDGEEALAMAIKERPDLIVSDVMMPKISGFDMLDILRSTTETKDVKVIMMTALSSEDQRARGEALGADRYLVKSQVGIEDVVRTVHEVLADSPTAAPAAPAPIVEAAPVGPAAPAPLPPIEPAPAPAPVTPAAPVAPIPEPTPTPAAAPTPAAPVAPVPTVTPIAPAPTPVADPLPPAAPYVPPSPVIAPDPVSADSATPVAPIAPSPTPEPLPQPTAPFSGPRPATLGDRVINPISPTESLQVPADMNTLISQELNAAAPPPPPVPPTPPAPSV